MGQERGVNEGPTEGMVNPPPVTPVVKSEIIIPKADQSRDIPDFANERLGGRVAPEISGVQGGVRGAVADTHHGSDMTLRGPSDTDLTDTGEFDRYFGGSTGQRRPMRTYIEVLETCEFPVLQFDVEDQPSA